MTDREKLYAERDPMALEPHYCRHVQAMTAEGLHWKSDIAAELAWRDQRIEQLEAALAHARQEPYCPNCWCAKCEAKDAQAAPHAQPAERVAWQLLEDLNIPQLERLALAKEAAGEERISCFVSVEWALRLAKQWRAAPPAQPAEREFCPECGTGLGKHFRNGEVKSTCCAKYEPTQSGNDPTHARKSRRAMNEIHAERMLLRRFRDRGAWVEIDPKLPRIDECEYAWFVREGPA